MKKLKKSEIPNLILLCWLFILTGTLYAAKGYDPNNIPFQYDKTKINYRLIGGIAGRVGERIWSTVNATDAENDLISFFIEDANSVWGENCVDNYFWPSYELWPTILTPLDNAYITLDGELYFTPTLNQKGIHYLNVFVTDLHTNTDSTVTKLSDAATIVIQIKTIESTPPKILPFGQ
jgi:hypothetical protein